MLDKTDRGMIPPRQRWQSLMVKADKVAKDGKGSLWERVKLLSQVFDDPQFKEAMETEGKKPGLVMNDKVADTFTNFAELYAMLKKFPTKEEWATGDLPRMRDQMRDKLIDEQKKKNLPKEKPANGRTVPDTVFVRNTVTVAQYRSLEEELKLLRQENKHLKEELALAKDTIEVLKGLKINRRAS